MTKGTNAPSGSPCTSFKEFQDKLEGLNTKSVTISAGTHSYTCDDPDAAKQITETLGSCKSTCARTTVSCSGEIWDMGECGGVEISVGNAFCSCGNTKIAMRPCQSSSSWGGHGATSCNADDQTFSISVHHFL